MPPKKIRKRGSGKRWKHYKRHKNSSDNPELAPTSIGDEFSSTMRAGPSSHGSTTYPSSQSQSAVEDEERRYDALFEPNVDQLVAPSHASTDEGSSFHVSCEAQISDNDPEVEEDRVTLDHNFCMTQNVGPATNVACVAASAPENIPDLLQQVLQKLQLRLPSLWVAFVVGTEINVVLVSRQKPRCIQRALCCSSNGVAELSIHSHPHSLVPYLEGGRPSVQLTSSTVDFSERILELVQKIRLKEICSGVDKPEYEDVWNRFLHLGEVDKNPYLECRYSSTFRSFACKRLVDSARWKCQECVKLTRPLRLSHATVSKEDLPPTLRNDLLTDKQKLKKLKNQSEEIVRQKLRVHYLQCRMRSLIAKEGVHVEEDLSHDLQKLLECDKLSSAQSMFLQQQIKASQKQNMCGMRWHPSMIRIALAVFVNSRSTYELIRDSGVIKLPSSRTLFDYSHPEIVKEGICTSTVRDVVEKVGSFQETYKKFHVLMADEMYISKNLVFHKASGELRGYMKLNELDKEIELMENFLDDPRKDYEPQIATKILSFLVKGVCTDIKAVVATFSVSKVSVRQMYVWTWAVIRTLERSQLWVAAFTCDGSPTNRAFIKMHSPVTADKFINEDEKIPGNAVYMTVNMAAPYRNLYFICDVPHLLKTIRNCFNNSRINRKKGKRRLKINGELIVWDTVIDLYNFKKGKMLRKSYKLNARNVYPDAYSCMKVSLAAQVMSETVATDIEQQNWPHTKEIVRFIRLVNTWFDCLNGANTYQGRRKRNPNLDPYTDASDARFHFLISFVMYLDGWRSQVEKRHTSSDQSAVSTALTVLDDSVSENEPQPLVTVEDVDETDDTPAGQAQLSHQTLLGIEVTVKAFISCTRFLLSEGCPFVNARAYCQDPLEQHFSKLRSGFGGSTNPNAHQCLNKQNTIHIMGQLGVKRKGNTEAKEGAFQLTEEPLKKRNSAFFMSPDS